MDFTDAVIFAGAIVVIVGSGILLGIGMGRGRNKREPLKNPEKGRIYSQVIASLDGLRNANDAHKREFIDQYYAVLMHGSDQVIRSLNTFLQSATASDDTFDSSVLATSRDQAVLAMRQDVQAQYDSSTGLQPQELYSIEISHGQPATSNTPVIKPEAQVDAPHPMPANQESPDQPASPPEPRPVPRGY